MVVPSILLPFSLDVQVVVFAVAAIFVEKRDLRPVLAHLVYCLGHKPRHAQRIHFAFPTLPGLISALLIH